MFRFDLHGERQIVAHTGNDRIGHLLRATALALAVVLIASDVRIFAQDVFGPAQPMTREQADAMMRARRGGPPPQTAAEPSKPEEKKEGEEKKDDEATKDDKKEEDTSLKRPKTPPRVPDPRELEVQLDERGRVPPFNFIGQPWPDVLQWFANLAGTSLDWQELPDDYLNLTTQRAYAVDEVRDLLNRHLQARGYTMLAGGEVLSVFKIDKIDPSLVPRVSEDELYDRKPYDFVKVSFELPEGMEVEKARDDIKQMLSPSARVFPLAATKRILVIDSVANQRTVSELLNQERLVRDGRIIPREFPLRYARAEQVIDVLYVMVGLDPKSRPTQMELQLQQKRLEIMAQMQQSGKDVSSMLNKDGPPVYLAYNRQRNSVLVNAPPEYMKIIERAIRYLDVPPEGPQGAESPLATTDAGGREFKKYQLVTMDPEKLALTLEEIGGLGPWTEMRADAKSKTLFVQGTAADHEKIVGLIDQLDGTGRELKVIWLPRRLPADAVAGSIYSLMSGQDEEDDEQQRRPFWYYSFRNQEEDKPKKGFRIDADVENNRLLLWANEAELAQVEQFLRELSADAPATGGARPVRIVEPTNAAHAERLLEHIRRAWPALGENELIIDDQRRPAEPPPEAPADEPAETPPADNSAADRGATQWHVAAVAVPGRLAELRRPASDESKEADHSPPAAADPKKPPITITLTDDGRLVISSQDTAALDRLEGFVEELTPPSNRFKIFRLQYAKAVDVYYNLKEYFEEELAGDRGQILDWWGYVQDTGPKDDGMRLSKRRKLQLIWDPPSNSILVANASPSQLYEIEQLIKEYDQPASADSTRTRVTRVVKVHYARASHIAAAIKDVYRDLLSSKDKEFDSSERKQQGSTRESVTVIRYGSGGSGIGDDGAKKSAPLKVGFEGALSIGADDVSNVLLVSAQEEIYDGVEEMIRRLDEEARPRTTVQVHRVSGTIDPKSLQKALSDALGTPWPGGRPEKAEPAKPADEKPKSQEGKPPGAGGDQGSGD